MVSMKDIAAVCGVSVATVSKALNNHSDIGEETKLRIKEVARENFVPIVENKPLARMLYYNVELEQEIPEELYQMAAEVLRYVYSLKAG